MSDNSSSVGETIRRFRYPIMLVGALCGLAAYIYTKRLTPVWLARVEIAVPSQGGGLGEVGALLSLSQDSPLQYLRGLFEARATRQELARTAKAKFNRPNANVPEIDKIFAAKAMVDTSQLILEVRHENKDFGIGLLNAATTYVKNLDEQTASQVAVKKFNAYEKALNEKTSELQSAQDALQKFTETAKTAPDPLNPFSGGSYKVRLQEIELKLGAVEEAIRTLKSQAQKSARGAATIPTDLPGAATWRQQLIDLELQLRIAEKEYSQTSPIVQSIRNKIDAAKKQFAEEVSKSLRSVEQEAYPGLTEPIVEREALIYQRDYLREMAAKAPTETRIMQDLMNAVKTKETVVQELKRQAEISSVEANVNRINWALLGEPYIVDEPVNKRAFQNGLVAGIGGLFLGVAIFFVFGRKKSDRIDS